MSNLPIGRLFPSGGPADPDMMIGRATEVDDLVAILDEGVHVLIAGDRRIGKTTVCRAAQAKLRDEHDMRVVFVEVPERSSSVDLCQLVVDRCLGAGTGPRLAKVATPLVQKLLERQGIPLDLSALGPEPVPSARRAVLELPLKMAADGRVLIVFDELQRAHDYADRDELTADLCDLYAGQQDAVVLVDGSNQRTFETLLGSSDGLGKLVHRRDLAPTIARTVWRNELPGHFEQAGHPIGQAPLDELLDYGAERPYPTMTAARHAALTAHRLGGETDSFCVEDGIKAAEKQLHDDGYDL